MATLKIGRRERAWLRSAGRAPTQGEHEEALRKLSHRELRRAFWEARTLCEIGDGWQKFGIIRRLPPIGPHRATVRFREDLKPP